ncbi:MAG: DivIVA domain-containing protein [Desulfobulbaceae bacterium]|nr:DivIVA domain-containing protein [Desulfobulbaceae bacterium]
MTITPQEIQSKQFHVRLRGFDADEVDKFLEKLSEEFLLLSLEHKQAFERIDSLEKEIANYRNKEQAFQAAILSAHRISDEMQERSRRESEEALQKARREAAALDEKSRQESEAILRKANRDAEAIKELAESKSREMVANLGAKIVAQTAEVNRLVDLKEAISTDLRHLLEGHLKHLAEGTPPGLHGLTHQPSPDPALLVSESPGRAPAPPQPETRETSSHYRQEAGAPRVDDTGIIYERIELTEDLLEPEPMARIATNAAGQDDQATLEMTDIEGLDLEDIEEREEFTIPTEPERRQAANISLDDPDDDMFFTLEDPLDDLEPSISIQGSNNVKRR